MADKIRRVTMRVDPYERLGELVAAARLCTPSPKGGVLAQTAASESAGMNRNTWGRVERDHERASDRTYAQMETFLGWEAGSILRYLDKGGPEPGPAPAVEEIDTGGQGQTFTAVYEALSEESKAALEEVARKMLRGERP